MKYREERKVEEIADMLEHGANLGIEGEGRGPSQERAIRVCISLGRELECR